jgi:hypothetical protein
MHGRETQSTEMAEPMNGSGAAYLGPIPRNPTGRRGRPRLSGDERDGSTMRRITLHVPEKLNDGSPVPEDVFESYEDDLYDITYEARVSSGFGEEGFNITRNVIGNWRSASGKKYREPLRLYWFDVADAEVVEHLVLRLAHRMKVELGQEGIYTTVTPVEASLVTELAVA